MFLYRRPLLSESYSLASLDGQQGVHPRAEVISIVFINPAIYIYIYIYIYRLKKKQQNKKTSMKR